MPTATHAGAEPPVDGLTRRWRARAALPGGTLIDRVLAARGLDDADSRLAFCHPTLHQLHDPGELPGVDAAADRLLGAIEHGEAIAIFGDYDVDGVTATAIVYHTLRALGADAVTTYVPHRVDEGYGLNADALRELAAGGHRVCVSVDCGVTAVAPAAAARDAGLDLIITDHHNPPEGGEPWPDAFAIVHPRAPGSRYPFPELCGAGVAFKLAWRLCTRGSADGRATPALRALLLDLLAFAALGTIADIVPLVGENRVLASFGLRRMRSTRFKGLNALVEASGLASDKVDEADVGFRLAPRLNAVGRLGHAREAVELFTDASPDRAAAIAATLTHRNDERRAFERKIAETAAERAEAAGMTGNDRRAIVLADAEWHPGVVGIACSRLVERFSRPTVLMKLEDDGSASGSARSVPGVSVHAAMTDCADLLDKFGGHDMAAGLRVSSGKLEEFTARFTDACNARLDASGLTPTLEYDARAALSELTPDAVAQLAALAPFGRDNPPVHLRLGPAVLAEPPRTMGATGDHLSLRLAADGRAIRIVAWGWAKRGIPIPARGRVEVVIEPSINTWNGRTSVEGRLLDLRAVD